MLWFGAIVVLIPVALWLLKRTPLGGRSGTPGALKTVAVLPLSPNQRVLAVEVDSGTERRWLVLGVTAQQITMLHSLLPPDAPAGAGQPESAAPFAQLLASMRQSKDGRAP